MQSVVTPEAEALPFDGAVAPGWLVPCELAGPITGTWYLAITGERRGEPGVARADEGDASPDEIGEALQGAARRRRFPASASRRRSPG